MLSIDGEFATCGVSGISELYNDHGGSRSSEEEEEVDKCEPEPLANFTEVHTLCCSVGHAHAKYWQA
jgi:hypothetical protein